VSPGKVKATTGCPAALTRLPTGYQDHPPCQAPGTKTKFMCLLDHRSDGREMAKVALSPIELTLLKIE
jgi:hypothetical protein